MEIGFDRTRHPRSGSPNYWGAQWHCRHWIEAILRGKYNDYLSAVKGTWQGTLDQRRGTIQKTDVTIDLKTKINVVYGELSYGSTTLKCVGGFVQDRYLSLHYRNKHGSKLQHGNIVLLLGGTNDKLTGDFVGVGPTSEKIVIGKIEVSK